ncbi:MAG: trypsin-like peptidase domain-containing protein [Bacteroidetes bacterium]|nr:trypsin-like peptidase domain-containing protein [Bacteroidota bacterium]MBU1115344.1 trypsin-like peptidase domain-containing protein [Bacteroidota bacterium]MBU1799667.1 trypsin-like peptidase domain-containing protein [Bacteroidota bacterium]
MTKFEIILSNIIITTTIVAAFFYLSERDLFNYKTSELLNNDTIYVNKVDKENSNEAINKSRNTIITNTVKTVSPAVVGISVKEIRQYQYNSPLNNHPFWGRFFGNQVFNKEISGLGSGAIISSDGYILTNDHVAGTADEITVTMSNGKHYKAQKVGTDLTSDICLLKINANNLPYIPFGNSDDILIGEWVIALGNPFGLFDVSDHPTVTVGVISASNMNLSPVDNRYYIDMIQTDASINQGNSGGPLVNSMGELIGMNTLIVTAQGSSGNVGVSFAIPSNKLSKVLNELKEYGIFERDYWTGLRIHSIDEGIAKYYKLTNTRGVIITDVIDNSPAKSANLEPGDIIKQINDFRIDNYETLKGVLQNYKTGETIEIRIIRNNNELTKRMKLEKRK